MDLTASTARDQLAAMRTKQVSARELLAEHLARMEAVNPLVRAVVTVDADRARVSARLADESLARGRFLGPLHGLPITVKDTFETAGLRTTSGSTALRDHRPTADAVAVARLRQAGAVIVGKTNTPELAGDWQTTNELFGTTHNPWDLSRTSGGSSGGSAAALAVGMTPLELGSDIGGSIRVPATLCGVAGHKPTHGVVPQRGHIPGPPGSLSQPDLGVVGPMARSVEDLGLALDVVAGPIPPQSAGWRLVLPEPGKRGLRAWRLAALVDDLGTPLDRTVRTVLGSALDTLAAAGASIDRQPALPVELHAVADLYALMLRPVVDGDRKLTHTQWLAANERRLHLQHAMEEFFARYDALLLPTFPVAAFPHDARAAERRTLQVDGRALPYTATALFWPALATLLHLPATALPVGLAPGGRFGLPVGIQVVGPYLGDLTTLAVAAEVERVIGRFPVPSPSVS
ncbi:MAG: amidase family protein [Actinomycetes bacterium]